MRSNHRSDTILLSNESRISRPCLEIFSRNRKVILSEKDLCVCYTAKKVAYRSFPQWEILAFVAFCLEEFASALQEKYSREAWNRTGTESSQFSKHLTTVLHGITTHREIHLFILKTLSPIWTQRENGILIKTLPHFIISRAKARL